MAAQRGVDLLVDDGYVSLALLQGLADRPADAGGPIRRLGFGIVDELLQQLDCLILLIVAEEEL